MKMRRNRQVAEHLIFDLTHDANAGDFRGADVNGFVHLTEERF
jgi:hypothetical protein